MFRLHALYVRIRPVSFAIAASAGSRKSIHK